MEPQVILLVDDNPNNLAVLYQTLNPRGYRVLAARDGQSALNACHELKPDLVLLDIQMPGMDGFTVCKKLKEDPELKDTPVIFLSALDDSEHKIQGLEIGAVDYIAKPFNVEEVTSRVNTHLTLSQLRRDLARSNEDLRLRLQAAEEEARNAAAQLEVDLIGSSPATIALRAAVDAAADSDRHVLLIGRPGSGEGAVSRTLHARSTRSAAPFIHLNCRNLSEQQSTILLHTQPLSPEQAPSKAELANGGSLCLDHIESLSPHLQEKLVAAINDKQLNPRLIVFSSADLPLLAKTGSFNAELLNLLDLRIPLPSLTDRREDLPELAQALINHEASRTGKAINGLDADSAAILSQHSWPGGIDELRSIIRHEVAIARTPILHIPASSLSSARIGSYELSEQIGSGGMGEVWIGHHHLLARPAAIKLIKNIPTNNEQLRQETVNRFEQEARITAKLTSPHTVQLYDFGVDEQGRFYFAMELLDGLDLARLVTIHGPQPAARVAAIMRQVCASLAEAHQAGLIHRDIKPANIFLCRMGLSHDFVKVLDFGIAKDRFGDHSLTRTGNLVGTPHYLAPESARYDTIDGRADLYSLACVAYYLLTGSPVFNGANAMNVVSQHLKAEPPRISDQTNTLIPPAFEKLVHQCLAKEPDQRPASALEVIKHIDAIDFDPPWTEDDATTWWTSVHMPTTGGQGQTMLMQ
ncbi:MAG: protein kinase domain-containing protein, partial [Planctomycetota bacterium]